MSDTIRQVVITKAGGFDVLKICERTKFAVGPGEVSIQVKAAGINFADIMARQGLYPDAPKLPCVVGYEVAGVVDSVGEGVTPGQTRAPGHGPHSLWRLLRASQRAGNSGGSNT